MLRNCAVNILDLQMMNASKTAIVLFEDDFRIEDNPALHYACENYKTVICLFVYQENYLGRNLGCASKVFLHNVLKSFNALLQNEYGTKLTIRDGNKLEILQEIASIIQIDAIYFNRSYTKIQIEFEKSVFENFLKCDVRSFKGKLTFEPWEVSTLAGEPFKVFTPFSKACLKKLEVMREIFPKPEKISSIGEIQSLTVEDLNLLPKNEGKWHQDILENWSFDYTKINDDFDTFLETKLAFYADSRNDLSIGNSNISPYLRFGILSANACFQVASFKVGRYDNQFCLELLWREFAYHTMYYNQQIATQELRSEYSGFPWEDDGELLEKWQKGETGFDIVDAGMHELWQTGTMHGRTRMVVASFLIKDLLTDWKTGEQWFWDCLFDADPAVNPFSWQWVFGSGFDGAPYFRIFNPDLQRQRFDEKGKYCTKWLGNFYNIERIVNHDFKKQVTLDKYKLLLNKL